MNTVEKLSLLRSEMKAKGIAAYLVGSSDLHQSEYVAQRWSSRSWLTGFDGSAGTFVITLDKAALWTDSRYFLQAEQQLAGSGILLQKQGLADTPSVATWLLTELEQGSALGFDGQCIPVAQAQKLSQQLSSKAITLEAQYDLVDQIWANRPALPASPLFELSVEFAGQTRESKLEQLRHWLKEQNVDAVFFPALDDIAWLLNIRAADVDYNPVCLSYLLVSQDQVVWCIDDSRMDASLRQQIDAEGIKLKPYQAALEVLLDVDDATSIAVSPANLSYHFYEQLKTKQLLEHDSPVQYFKSIKNETEVKNLRHAMKKDGVALLRLFRWLEEQLRTRTVSEVEVAEQLAMYRSQQAHYHGESFGAIVGYKGNGAIVHYRATEEQCAMIENEGMLLLDSGGQYWDGTTDITRTLCFSEPSADQKKHFTLVLKGMIAVSMAQFPKGTSGVQLDTLARQFLWKEALNFGHGTGHGVGFFLNVHEGPQGIAASPHIAKTRTAFAAGMLTSNEPGFYLADAYGIRIENLVLCVPATSSAFGDFLAFETLTLFPIEKNLIDTSILTAEEQQWLNAYHQKVFNELSPLLAAEETAWLKDKCAAL